MRGWAYIWGPELCAGGGGRREEEAGGAEVGRGMRAHLLPFLRALTICNHSFAHFGLFVRTQKHRFVDVSSLCPFPYLQCGVVVCEALRSGPCTQEAPGWLVLFTVGQLPFQAEL